MPHAHRTRTSTRVCLLSLALIIAGCSTHGPPLAEQPAPADAVPVRVVNDSHDIVDVFFVALNGERFRVGMVPPLTTRAFEPRGFARHAGYFHAHRKGHNEKGVQLRGIADPQVLGEAAFLVTIGPTPELDWWVIS